MVLFFIRSTFGRWQANDRWFYFLFSRHSVDGRQPIDGFILYSAGHLVSYSPGSDAPERISFADYFIATVDTCFMNKKLTSRTEIHRRVRMKI